MPAQWTGDVLAKMHIEKITSKRLAEHLGYLKKLFYALNDASLELGKMIDQKDVKENEVKAARAYRHNRICDCTGRGRRRLL